MKRTLLTTATLLAAMSNPVSAKLEEPAAEAGNEHAQLEIITDDVRIVDLDGGAAVLKIGEAGQGVQELIVGGPGQVEVLPGGVVLVDGDQLRLHVLEGQAQVAAQPPKLVEAAFLGVNAQPLDFETAERLGVPRGTGLKIAFVAEDSPATAAGLQKDDVLTKLGDQVLVNAEQFAALIRTHQGGDTVTLHAIRGGEPIELQADLVTREMPELGPGGSRLERAWRVQQFVQPLHAPGLIEIAPGPGALNPGNGDNPVRPEIEERIREVRERIRQHRIEMEQRMNELRRQLDLDLEELRENVGPGAHRDFHSSVTMSDGEHTLQLKSSPDGKHLTVKTAEGEVLYDGELPEGGQVEGLAPGVQQKIDNLLNNNRIELKLNPAEPAPQPEPKRPENAA